jgi:anti-anti-sigma factor
MKEPAGYLAQWTGGQAVVALPEHIDQSDAGQIREELLLVINRGASVLIADMTRTVSCDHAGADAMARAYQRAAASGTHLRLAVTAQAVRRVLTLNGLDRVISIYPSLDAAAAAAVSMAPCPGGLPSSATPA